MTNHLPVRVAAVAPTTCLLLLCACGQVGYRAAATAPVPAGFHRVLRGVQDPEPEARPRVAEAPERGTPYGRTRARLQFFREDVELDEIDLEIDGGPDGVLRDTERTRSGFRADFGRGSAGGFFQVFVEEFDAAGLSVEELDLLGIGGGVVGTPKVAAFDRVEVVVPYRFEIDLVGGSDSSSGFDEDLVYLEGMFELGFGARAFGLQASSGVQVRSLAGRFDSDHPASPSGTVESDLDGTNVGAWLELLWKHDTVPLMVRLRGIAGDVRGVEFSFGFAF